MYVRLLSALPLGLAATALSLVCAPPSLAGQKVTLGRAVPANQFVSMDQIDHGIWDGLLKRYVDNHRNVAYARWKQSAQDTQALDSYLGILSAANPRGQASKEAKLAFWINAYNAVTVRGILREYPTTSIRNHTAKLYGYNIWDDLLLSVGGSSYSLNQMEHEVLRKMGEPRIHFAIVCASRSCPRLLNEAYAADTLDAQLTTNSKELVRLRFRIRSMIFRFRIPSSQLRSAPCPAYWSRCCRAARNVCCTTSSDASPSRSRDSA